MNRERELESWLDGRPPEIAEVARRLPPWTCYRSTKNRGHYILDAYEEHEDGTVTVKVEHLEDSFLFGFHVFGVQPETLKRCGCIELG